jgi:Spermidine/putrescine-binding periplasmic protein
MRKLTVLLLISIVIMIPLHAEEEYRVTGYSDSVDWRKYEGMSVNVYNWGEYIAVDEGDPEEFDVNKEFEKLTGIKVNYTNFASNEELYAKLKSGGSQYDVIIPSDYMLSRLIRENMLEKINFDNVPNFDLIFDDYKNPDYDPTNEYSVPYMWGTLGIVYNTTLVDEEDDVETWDIMWNEKYANNMLMFSNSRDAFAIALLRLGYSLNTTSEKELRDAADLLKDQKYMIQAYVMDEIYDKMGGGEAALAPYYAGDAIVMMDDNPDLDFVIPREGTNLFVDAMCIPKGAPNKEAAEMYINFICETTVALYNCEYIGYSTPHSEAFELLDDELKENEIIYPPAEVLENTEVYVALPEDTTKLVDSLWTEILSEVGTNPWLTPIFIVVALGLTIYIHFWRRQKKLQKEMQG